MNNFNGSPVLRFAKLMQDKLDENDNNKGTWQSCDDDFLFNRLQEEILEVKKAIKQNKGEKVVMRECADVANFIMMIADNYEPDIKI